MEKLVINTEKAPSAIGPYSQAVKTGNMLFISGQLPIEPESGEIAPGGAGAQAEQSLKNLFAILKSAGLVPENVVKATVYLKNLEDFDEVNRVYSSYFTAEYPARVCLEVSRLPKDALVEIDAIACF